MPSPTWTSMLLGVIPIFLALCHVVLTDDEVQQLVSAPSRLHPYRRLFGIRRLKPMHPLPPPSSEHRPTSPIRRQQPRNYEIIELPDFVPRAQVPPSFEDRRIAVPHIVEPIIKKPVFKETSDDEDELKRKKIEARWRRLGINPKTIYYPTRKPKVYESEEEAEEGTVTNIPEIVRATRERLRNNKIQQLNIEERERIVRPAHLHPINKDNINVPSTPNTRKSVPSVFEDKDVKPRPRIQGPILTSSGDLGAPVQTPAIPRVFAPISSPTGDYHSRTIPVRRNYQFMEKLSQRPRLRIRRPGEPRIDDFNNEFTGLTPFESNARNKAGFGGAGFTAAANAGAFANLPQQPQLIVTSPPPPPSPPPTTTPLPPPPPPPQIEPPTTVPPQPPAPSIPEENGDSGAGFGLGPSELPPEFANIGFGIGGSNGNGISFPAEDKAPRPKQRKQPNPELEQGEPLIIPQNSGLRPVAPPKEFGGGFGPSGGGSFGSGFGGGSGGFNGGSGFGGGGGKPSAPEPNEADFFTGDSALTPSRGPTGDGYGPPVFPGGNPPPPVASVGMGGAAAGKSPYGSKTHEVNQNAPTAVRPSAMYNILSKADLAFNQGIQHFERGTPVESAALDILEVALGSEKLDSQAKLLGHVDRTIGLDNLQRIQRWANTAGAMDFFKEQFVRLAKNFEPAEDLLPTVPPQFEYLFKKGR